MKKGYFGQFGGQYVPESVMEQLFELEKEVGLTGHDQCFWNAYQEFMEREAGKEAPLVLADKLSAAAGCRVYLKREDESGMSVLGPAGGQLLLWKRIGYEKAVAETGAGLWGLAVAKAAKGLGLSLTLFVAREEAKGQEKQIWQMRSYGAEVLISEKNGFEAAVDYWEAHSKDTCMVMTGDYGPFPCIDAVISLQALLGARLKEQLLEAEGKLPFCLSMALAPELVLMGYYTPFLEDQVMLLAAEPEEGCGAADGTRLGEEPRNGVPVRRTQAIVHGMRTLAFQDEDGNVFCGRKKGEKVSVLGAAVADGVYSGRLCLETVSKAEQLQAEKLAYDAEGICLGASGAQALALAWKKKDQKDTEGYLAVIVNREEENEQD